ncbi:hypothetical protein VSU19_16460 [Verrucomicrobiales bacterium BCK34]|nr:hypothetical protein [Verrucomicrobiales bacterium BCK34]
MEKEHQSFTDSASPSQKTDQIREFFTAMLATVAIATAVFGLVSKLSDSRHDTALSAAERSSGMINAKSVSREFSVEVDPTSGNYTGITEDSLASDSTSPERISEPAITPVKVIEPGTNPDVTIGETDSHYAKLLAYLKAGETPPAELYVAASKELLSKGAGADAKTIIQSGVIAHPDSIVMALGSADVRAATGNAESAWNELAQSGDTSNAEVMSRLIKYATTAGKVDETMTILGDLEMLPWTPSAEDWSNLVSMLTDAGRFEEAKTAVDLSPEKKVLKTKLEAIEKLEKGEFDKALEKINEYVDRTKNLTPEDWALLGEIHTGLGNQTSANDAYRRAEGLKQQQAVEGGGFWDFLAGLFGGA